LSPRQEAIAVKTLPRVEPFATIVNSPATQVTWGSFGGLSIAVVFEARALSIAPEAGAASDCDAAELAFER
jgi:hypothetical protein